MDHARHDYLSDACYHAEHNSCGTAPAGETGARGPASCRFCGATCRCACHPVAPQALTRSNYTVQITAARKRKGWTQGLLADMVGVSQQLVSGWETGAPPPSGTVLRRLCTVLGLEPDLDSDLEPDAELDTEFQTPLALAPLATLPFRDLEPGQFTAFATDLIAAVFPDAAAIDTGLRRKDIALAVETPSGERIGVKCIQGRKFHTSSFDKARSETDLDASGFDRCLLLLRTGTSARVQEHAAAHPVWEIWDVPTIIVHLRALEPATALQLVDRYFPGLGAPFLGIEP